MERCIGGKACLERNLMVVEPRISVHINKMIQKPKNNH